MQCKQNQDRRKVNEIIVVEEFGGNFLKHLVTNI